MRSGIGIFFFGFSSLIEFCFKRKTVNYSKIFDGMQIIRSLVTACFLVIFGCGLVYSANNMIQTKAYVLCNLNSLYILIIRGATGQRPSNAELYGLGVASLGCICTLLDHKARRIDGLHLTAETFCIALMTSLAGAMLLLFN